MPTIILNDNLTTPLYNKINLRPNNQTNPDK